MCRCMRARARGRAILLATRWRLPPRARPLVHLFSSPPLSSRTSISTCTISFPFPFAARSRITFTSSPLFSVSCILVRLCNPLSPRSTNPPSPRSTVRPSRPAARRPVPCNSYFFIIFVALFDLLFSFSFSFSYFSVFFCALLLRTVRPFRRSLDPK